MKILISGESDYFEHYEVELTGDNVIISTNKSAANAQRIILKKDTAEQIFLALKKIFE